MTARTVIYDGECGFCKRHVHCWQKLDWLHKIEWLPRLAPGLEARFPQISAAASKDRMLSIRPDGKVYGGFYAVRDILRYFPLTFFPALVMYIPGMSFFGVPVYQWIANNRHRFKSQNCLSH